jgi:hypothetical protein
MHIPAEQVSPYALGPRDGAAFIGIGLTKFYELLGEGAFPSRRIGRRTIILRHDLVNYIEGIAPAPPAKEAAHG